MAASKIPYDPSIHGIIPKVSCNKSYGYSDSPINIDMINDQNGYMYSIAESDGFTGTSPASIIGGNGYLLIGQSGINNGVLRFGVQLAFGFGSSKLAIRNANYKVSGTSWSAWREI